ncbi:MAG: polyadenylate-specific 3'-exoribonuclease AS [Corynebacterium sp.]|nr:polyadenylate-specific 3'-exoribonuclease AS [Corynebacterium sp.]
MRYFYDTEFIEDGTTITLISIGVVAADGREYYAVSTDADLASAGKWVREHVLPKLPNPSSPLWKSNTQIRQDLLDFFAQGEGRDGTPELWAWVGAYDHIVLAQLWGDMAALPAHIPHYTRELRQYWEMAGRPTLPKAPSNSHDALADARHNAVKFQACMQVLPLDHRNAVQLPPTV